MYQHILISTDGSDLARKGVDHGLTLAKHLNAKVTLMTVTEPFPLEYGAVGLGWIPSQEDIDGFEAARKKAADEILGKVKAAADTMGVEASVLHVPDARPAEAIVDAAKARGCSLIVMASHGRRGLGRILLGSQTAEVVAHSPVPVLVVR
ncbi:MAG: universal stress protein [Rhizobiaceae bacterium]|nr:universal stress protein [Rhizobiaceae bacterium]